MIEEKDINNMAQWCYDTDFTQFIEDMKFEHFTEDYCYEKFLYMRTRFTMWIGNLSKEYRANLAEAINNKGSRYETDNKK